MRASSVLKQGNLVGIMAFEVVQLVVVCHDVTGIKCSRCDGDLQFTDMPERGRAAIHENPGPVQRRIIHLTHIRAIGADQVDMLAGLQPHPFDQWIGGHGGRCDNIGTPHRLFQIIGDRNIGKGRLHRAGPFGRAVPDRELRAGKSSTIGFAQRMPHGASANNQDVAAVWTGQTARRQQTVTRRFPLGHQCEIQDRLQGAILPRKQVHRPRNHGFSRCLVARKDRGTFDRQPQTRNPRGPVQQGVFAFVQEHIRHLRLRPLMARHQSVRQRQPVQVSLALLKWDHHRHCAASLLSNPSATSRSAQPCGPSNRCVCQPRPAATLMLSIRSSAKSKPSGGTPQSASTRA